VGASSEPPGLLGGKANAGECERREVLWCRVVGLLRKAKSGPSRNQPKNTAKDFCSEDLDQGQEIRKVLGHLEIRESARKSPGKYLNSAGNLAYLRLRCSGEPQEEKKITKFFPFSFFFWKSQGKISFLIYLR